MRKNIVLVGFMGAGKSVVGRALANRLKLDFVDLDEVIETRQKRPITTIFADSGEAYFRAVEKSLVKEFSRQNGLVIACGGGAVVDPENMDDLKSNGVVIYLKAGPEAIFRRTRGKALRPLLNVVDPQEQIIQLLQKREPFYSKADFIVDTTSLTIEQVTEAVNRIAEHD